MNMNMNMNTRTLLVVTLVGAQSAACEDPRTPAQLAATLVDVLSAGCDDASADPNGQNDAIRQLHADVDAAWNRSDAAAMATLWSVAGTNLSPLGVLSEGRDAIEADLAARFAEGLAGTEHRLTLERVYWIDTGLAVADGDAEISNLVGPDGMVYPPLASKFTSVSIQQPSGEWRLEHMRAYVFLQPGD
jgi:uncharacterized protein (TIGR02246 family)